MANRNSKGIGEPEAAILHDLTRFGERKGESHVAECACEACAIDRFRITRRLTTRLALGAAVPLGKALGDPTWRMLIADMEMVRDEAERFYDEGWVPRIEPLVQGAPETVFVLRDHFMCLTTAVIAGERRVSLTLEGARDGIELRLREGGGAATLELSWVDLTCLTAQRLFRRATMAHLADLKPLSRSTARAPGDT